MKTKIEIKLIQGNATMVAHIVFDAPRVDENVQTIVVPNMISERTETRGGVYYGPFEGVFDAGEKPKSELTEREEKKPEEDPVKEIVVEAPT